MFLHLIFFGYTLTCEVGNIVMESRCSDVLTLFCIYLKLFEVADLEIFINTYLESKVFYTSLLKKKPKRVNIVVLWVKPLLE